MDIVGSCVADPLQCDTDPESPVDNQLAGKLHPIVSLIAWPKEHARTTTTIM